MINEMVCKENAGESYDNCRSLIDALNWDGIYPEVDVNGNLTGRVIPADSTDHKICDVRRGGVVFGDHCCDAMILNLVSGESTMSKTTYLSDIEIGSHANSGYVNLLTNSSPSSLAFEIASGEVYINVTELREFCERDDVSLSGSERSELLDLIEAEIRSTLS